MSESRDKKYSMISRLFSRKNTTKSKSVEESLNEMPGDDSNIIEVFEHERWRDQMGWSCRNLEIGDPKRYVFKSGQSEVLTDPPLPDDWRFDGNWRVDMDLPGSDDGWLYGLDFRTIDRHITNPLKSEGNMRVRKRRLIRPIKYVPNDSTRTLKTSDLDDGNNYDIKRNNSTENDIFEIHSDDDEDEDDDKSTFFLFNNRSDEFSSKVIRDPQLLSIGRQMKSIEAECKKEEEAQSKEWLKSVKPEYEIQIEELTKRVNEMKGRIDSEGDLGLAHIEQLQSDHIAYSESLEDLKKRNYFPRSRYTLGCAGVYLAMDDLWLEYASGQFHFEIIPHKDSPQIHVVFSGTSGNTSSPDSGMSIRMRVDGFKMKGEKGTKYPKVSMDKIKITATIRITIVLYFDVSSSKWISTPKNFRIDLLSFRGPYGTRRSVVSTWLAVITPMLRTMVLEELPLEFGLFIRTLPSPVDIRGKFEIRGTNIKVLSRAMHKDNYLCELLGYTPQQLYVFQNIQKSLDRGKTIKTLGDLLVYREFGYKYPKKWDQLRNLWGKAATIYFDKLSEETGTGTSTRSGTGSGAASNHHTRLIFENLLQAAEDMLRKPVDVIFTLQHLDSQLSLTEALKFSHQYMHRQASRNNITKKNNYLIMILEKIQQDFLKGQSIISTISGNLDFAQLRLQMEMHSGIKGRANIIVSELLAQAPLNLKLFLSNTMNMGYVPPVPFMTSVKPLENGDIHIELNHLGSELLLIASNYIEWEEAVAKGGRGAGGEEDEEYFDDVDVDAAPPRRLSSPTPDASSLSAIPPMAPIHLSSEEAGDGGDSAATTAATTPDSGHRAHNAVSHTSPLFSVSASSTGNHRSHFFSSIGSSHRRESQGSTASAGLVDNPNKKESVSSSSSSTAIANSSVHASSGGSSSSNTGTKKRSSSVDSSVTCCSPSAAGLAAASALHCVDEETDGCRMLFGSEYYRQLIEDTMAKRPKGLRSVHNVVRIVATKPHLSLVVDKTVTLKPGSELFTFALGPRDAAWKPFSLPAAGSEERGGGTAASLVSGFERRRDGSVYQTESDGDSSIVSVSATSLSESPSGKEGMQSTGFSSSVPLTPNQQRPLPQQSQQQQIPHGLPVVMQTGVNVKFLAQVPRARITVRLPSVLRFASAFFDDLTALKNFLERGFVEYEEQLLVGKVVIDRIGKYLLLPGLDFVINITGKLVALQNEITLRLETPMAIPDAPTTSTPGGGGGSGDNEEHVSGGDKYLPALRLRARVNLMDIFEDSKAVQLSVQMAGIGAVRTAINSSTNNSNNPTEQNPTESES